VTQEMACSLDRPPKTTATRIRLWLLMGLDPTECVERSGRTARRGPASASPADRHHRR
jgi:hypothetical protein